MDRKAQFEASLLIGLGRNLACQGEKAFDLGGRPILPEIDTADRGVRKFAKLSFEAGTCPAGERRHILIKAAGKLDREPPVLARYITDGVATGCHGR